MLDSVKCPSERSHLEILSRSSCNVTACLSKNLNLDELLLVSIMNNWFLFTFSEPLLDEKC